MNARRAGWRAVRPTPPFPTASAASSTIDNVKERERIVMGFRAA
jgi:hypothetical protein